MTTATAQIRVLAADDHALFRAGVRTLIDAQPDMRLVEEARDGHEAVERVLAMEPDVVVMDVSMPHLDGIAACERLAELGSTARVICLSMHDDRKLVGAALRAGVAGYVLKDAAAEELVLAIRATLAGNTYLSPAITEQMLAPYRGTAVPDAQIAGSLSRRETEILRLLASGLSVKEIAHDLRLSAKTVTTHRENLMRKIDVHTVAGLTKYAIREGLVSLTGDEKAPAASISPE